MHNSTAMQAHRIFVEKHGIHAVERRTLLREIRDTLGISALFDLRHIVYYNVFGLTLEELQPALSGVFAEIPRSWLYLSLSDCIENTQHISPEAEYFDYTAMEYLPGQYDTRADAAEQCLHILGYHGCTVTSGQALILYQHSSLPASPIAAHMASFAAEVGHTGLRTAISASPLIKTKKSAAKKNSLQSPEFIISSAESSVRRITDQDVQAIQAYIINPVEMRLCSLERPPELAPPALPETRDAAVYEFISAQPNDIAAIKERLSLALDEQDLLFIRDYFRDVEKRAPTLAELKFFDAYWSDHCRHTTFLTHIQEVVFPNKEDEALQQAWRQYIATRAEVYAGYQKMPPVTLMDLATLAGKCIAKQAGANGHETPDENNACCVPVQVTINGVPEPWLFMFKNETHNHPTEIEPFGGASTCLGGAIRDPLSGRAYVFSAMRVSGGADPREAVRYTLEGKLPQRLLAQKALHGFSSYGNQVGLACNYVQELYHPGYKAKRLEAGFVMGAAPRKHVVRAKPVPGDVIVVVGGRTGRDGIGGAAGSSQAHTEKSLHEAAAEVQKGNPVEERKIQRLFAGSAAPLIKRCNDFGAGGLAVAAGELADGISIDLGALPLKYSGLRGDEIALSESQERMAVVLDAADLDEFYLHVQSENLEATTVGRVTNENRIVMTWNGNPIINISREFLGTNGAKKTARAAIESPSHTYALSAPWHQPQNVGRKEFWDAIDASFDSLRGASRAGMQDRFDSTIGASTVLMPYGGFLQCGQEEGAAALFPAAYFSLYPGAAPTRCSTAALSAASCPLALLEQSPFHGASYAVVDSLAKLAAMGAHPLKAHLSFQEYFKKPAQESANWGQPLAALLGAFCAQMHIGVPAIGGKDSMSGSFHDLHVPPTFISFAAVSEDAGRVRSTQVSVRGAFFYLLLHVPQSDGSPDYDALTGMWEWMYKNASLISAASVLGDRNILHAAINMCAGNGMGCALKMSEELFYTAGYGSMLIACEKPLPAQSLATTPEHRKKRAGADEPHIVPVGRTTSDAAIHCLVHEHGAQSWRLADIMRRKARPLEDIFPYEATKLGAIQPRAKSITAAQAQYKVRAGKNIALHKAHAKHSSRRTAKSALAQTTVRTAASLNSETSGKSRVQPRVCIPVFPGTNCEIDTLRMFEREGALCRTVVFRNKTKSDISDSLSALAKNIAASNILALAGGFSAGDEPDGSGKFISLVLQNAAVKNAIFNLLYGDGLVLGICNGFQALVKSGWLPFGKPSEHGPLSGATLTNNACGHHISRIVTTRITHPASSPWLSLCTASERYLTPVSHGEGRFCADEAVLKTLVQNKQIVSVYDKDQNPNGSELDIEGIVSPDGRIFGRMGHGERVLDGLYKNIPGMAMQPIARAGVMYFS